MTRDKGKKRNSTPNLGRERPSSGKLEAELDRANLAACAAVMCWRCPYPVGYCRWSCPLGLPPAGLEDLT